MQKYKAACSCGYHSKFASSLAYAAMLAKRHNERAYVGIHDAQAVPQEQLYGRAVWK